MIGSVVGKKNIYVIYIYIYIYICIYIYSKVSFNLKENISLGTQITRLSLEPTGCFAHYVKLSFVYGLTAIVDLGLLIIEGSRSHSGTPHSVGLL